MSIQPEATDYESIRRQSQLDFVASGQPLTVGSEAALPLPVAELLALTVADPRVEAHFGGGLTGEVLCLRVGDQRYNIKRKLAVARVANVDGQTSFLTEVQRRADFTRLKADASGREQFANIVDTLYADFRQGLMVSPWIPGAPLTRYDRSSLRQIHQTLANMVVAGIFEWDLCPGNLLDDGERVWLFDFGYCWTLDPLTMVNSNGMATPLFHPAERFETRNLFSHLLKLEQAGQRAEALALFRLEKEEALAAYLQIHQRLKARGANSAVLDHWLGYARRWQQALERPGGIEELYLVEGYRSHLLDVHDDISGKSCTPMTLLRVAAVEEALHHHFALLKASNGLFFGDENRSQQQLLAINAHHAELARQYQL